MMGIDVIRRLLICFGLAMFAFGVWLPKIAGYADSNVAPSASPTVAIDLAATITPVRLYTVPAADGGTAYSVQVAIKNDGDDAVYVVKSGSIFWPTTADASVIYGHLKNLARELVELDPKIEVPSFRIAHGETLHFDAGTKAVFAADHQKYQRGDLLYYFVGRVRLKASGKEKIIGFGGVTGAKAPVVLSASDDVLKILETP